MTPLLVAEIHFDLICPWCLIGKRHLDAALQQLKAARPEVASHIVWRSSPLLPDIPAEGLPYQDFYERRLGGAAAVAARRAQVRQAASFAGLTFDFDGIEVMPNTLAAHRLVAWAQDQVGEEKTETLIDGLFGAYFMAGRNIGDAAVLLDIARESGIVLAPEVMDLLSPGPQPERDEPFSPRRRDVPGVPFYVFNDRIGLSGAYPANALLGAMQDALSPS